jgi:uncharacterized membrane protein
LQPQRTYPRGDDFEDLLGGRFLAWTGGAAVLTGIGLLLALAISRGWLGPAARVGLGGAGSLSLAVLGAWLHEQRGRTHAALAATAAGLIGLFATFAVATDAYRLISPGAGLACAALAAGGATVLSIRWRSRTLAAVSLGGALLAPLFLGGAGAGLGGYLVLVLIAFAAAAAVLVAQDWPGLALGAFVLAAPQVAVALIMSHVSLGDSAPYGISVGWTVLALTAFGGLGAAAAVGFELRVSALRLRWSAASLLALNATVVALTGAVSLGSSARAGAWLVVLGVVHAVAGVALRKRSEDFSLVALGLAAMLGDGAAAVLLHGPALALVYAGSAVAFAALRRSAVRSADGNVAFCGLGGHIALVVLQLAVVELPASGGGLDGTGMALGLSALIAACFTSAQLAQDDIEAAGFEVVGLLSVVLLTAVHVHGPALVAAFGGEAFALAKIAQARDDELAEGAALAFLCVGLAVAVAMYAPPVALARGPGSAGDAALSLAAVVACACGCAWVLGTRWLFGCAAFVALYLGSIELVGAFQGGPRGQLLLSVMWGLVGAVAVLAGLRRALPALRYGGLAVLVAAACKVFLYDLATLESVYRVVSFIALGLLLLGAAYGYQRSRPTAPEDLRSVPPALR